MSVKQGTVEKWIAEFDPKKEWIRAESSGGAVTKIICKMCREKASSLRGLRNYSTAFVDGISGSALKKDNVAKHSRSDMHTKAVNLGRNVTMTLQDIYRSTPLGKAIAGANAEDHTRLKKLFEVAYFVAAEELPFAKYPGLVDLEKRHGVSLGSTYCTPHKCSEFVEIVGETMRDSVLQEMKSSKFMTILIDGSTDSSVKEKELMYVSYVSAEQGCVQAHFLALKDVADCTATGLIQCIDETFISLGVNNWRSKLVCMCMDGAAVNLGVRRGVAALLRTEYDMPWLIAVHCFNHRLELAAKDAFKNTYLDEVSNMLMNIYYVYHKSPKRLRDLRTVAEEMDEQVTKPEKAHGTRWLQHKKRAVKVLLNCYPVLVGHFQSLAEANSADGARFRGYLRQLTSFKFVSNLLVFDAMLTPLGALSTNLQCSSVDLQFAVSSLSACRTMVDRIRNDECPDLTPLHSLLADVEEYLDSSDANEGVLFKGIKLSGVTRGSVNELERSRQAYAGAVQQCLDNRFRDLETQAAFKGVGILNTSTWPGEEADLDQYGVDTLTAVYDHFEQVLDGADKESLVSEWDAFKSFWKATCRQLSSSDVWVVLFKHQDVYPNLWLLVQILLLFPVSNAVVERGFSAMRRIKTDWRCNLKESTLDHLMRIAIEGPEPSRYDVSKAVERFFSTPRRPDVQPYKRKHTESQ